jgi:hypothetical protein
LSGPIVAKMRSTLLQQAKNGKLKGTSIQNALYWMPEMQLTRQNTPLRLAPVSEHLPPLALPTLTLTACWRSL